MRFGQLVKSILLMTVLVATGTNVRAQQKWVPYNGIIPANAVVGGIENGQPLFVGRMSFQGGTHPGKVLPGGFCNIGWGGKEYSINSGFEILTALPNTVEWMEYRGTIPTNAVVGGYNDAANREPLYVAKHAYMGGEHCGKLWAGNCNIGWGGAEIVLNEKIYILVAVPPKSGVTASKLETVTEMFEAPNLALGKLCTQSSRSAWSSHSEQGAVDGVKNGGFGFHTGPGPAWWQVDLGASHSLDHVLIYNRTDCCAERARTVQVLLSDNGTDFRMAYAHNGTVFGGVADGNQLTVGLNGARARYVRLQITSADHFHLDEVEIYGSESVIETPAISPVRWVSFDGTIPANAVVGGSENGQPLYVGRMPFQGGVHPGKVLPGGFCNIGWGGKEYSVNTGFEILTASTNATAWVEYRGSVPANAILGGQNDPGGLQPLYIAKHAYHGGEHCGKLWANACNIGWGGQEIVLTEKIYILTAGGDGVLHGSMEARTNETVGDRQTSGAVVIQSQNLPKLKLPKEVKMLLTVMGVSQEETDLASTVLGTVAHVVGSYENQSSDFLTGKKQELQALLQQLGTLKSGNINKVPFFQTLIANGEKDLNKLIRKTK